MKKKRLNLNDRILIQENIVKRTKKSETALALNKTISTISREINTHKFAKYIAYKDNPYDCKYFKSCKVCTGKCSNYVQLECTKRDRTIGACNNCEEIRKCNMIHYIYDAKKAQKEYEDTLVTSRAGVDLTREELIDIAHTITPEMKKGHSVYVVLNDHPELKLCPKTLYNYIEMGLFKDWGLDNFTLKRKLQRKQRKTKKLRKRSEPVDYTDRKYEDYLIYKKLNPDKITTEMDTVYNNQSGPYIQTFIFGNTEFMIGILHKEKTADSMSNTLNQFQNILTSKEYNELFSLILTDRGSEFSKPTQFEINMDTGELRTKLFYCDPQMPSQKPHVENNHTILRYILPKKANLSDLTQEKLDLIFSHTLTLIRELI